MGTLALFVLPMWLCSVCFQGTNAIEPLIQHRHPQPLNNNKENDRSVNRRTNGKRLRNVEENDTALNAMATDVVRDVLGILIPYAKDHEKRFGPLKTIPLRSVISVAGIYFGIRSEEGIFEGFPSLQTTGETTVAYVFDDRFERAHHVRLNIPITFENFALHYNKVTVRNANQTWNGSISLKIKRNSFTVSFNVDHDTSGSCEANIGLITVDKESDGELDIKMKDMPNIKLNHLALRDNYWTMMTVLEDAFSKYLALSDTRFPNGLLGYCRFRPS